MEYNSGSIRASNFYVWIVLHSVLYQLIVSLTKCENISLGIFINVRERFQNKSMIGYNIGWNYQKVEARLHDDCFSYLTSCQISLGIFINLRERFQCKNLIGYNFGWNYPNVVARPHDDFLKKNAFFLYLTSCQSLKKNYLNKSH